MNEHYSFLIIKTDSAGDSQSLTFPGIDKPGKIRKPPSCEPVKVQDRRLSMDDEQNLSPTKRECNYHLIWIYRLAVEV